MIVPSGIRGDVVIALSLNPTPASLRSTVRQLGGIIEQQPGVPVELASVEPMGSRIALVVTVTLGSVDDVKAGAPSARIAATLLARLVRDLAGADPVLVPVPDPAQPGAIRARRLAAGFDTVVAGLMAATGAPAR